MTHTHTFIPSDKPGYEQCLICNSYHSTKLSSPEELYETGYWERESGRSTFAEQIRNVSAFRHGGYSKVEKTLSHIDKPGKLLELACSPGVLLNKARKLGCEVTGVEPDYNYIDAIKLVTGPRARVLCGYFPQVERLRPPYDYIVAMDLLEHIEDYRSFVQAVYSILAPGGKAIFMSPIILEDGLYRECDFIAHEHAWIFSIQYIREYFGSVFKEVKEDIWQMGHNIIIGIK